MMDAPSVDLGLRLPLINGQWMSDAAVIPILATRRHATITGGETDEHKGA